MKLILISLLSLFSVAASAQTCDVTWTFALTQAGSPVAENTRVLHGLDAGDMAKVQQRGQHALDVGSKEQDKGGDYTIVLGQESTCPSTLVPSVTLSGLTRKGVVRFLRQAAKGDADLYTDMDVRGGKGKWGK